MSRPEVGIVGLGLMGGSLARALKASDDPPRIRASSLSREDLDGALSAGVIDHAHDDPADVVSSAELVILATPIDAAAEILRSIRDRIRADAVVTDVVSLKAPLASLAEELGLGPRWVGGHPMTGSERSGFAAARADLFHDATVFLVRGSSINEAADRVERLWTGVGGRVRWTEADAHDRLMVWASHLPQLLSNALATTLAKEGVDPGDLGPGGRDMTRLAASAPELWEGLLTAAGSREVEALIGLAEEIRDLAETLDEGDAGAVAEYMARTRAWREDGTWS